MDQRSSIAGRPDKRLGPPREAVSDGSEPVQGTLRRGLPAAPWTEPDPPPEETLVGGPRRGFLNAATAGLGPAPGKLRPPQRILDFYLSWMSLSAPSRPQFSSSWLHR